MQAAAVALAHFGLDPRLLLLSGGADRQVWMHVVSEGLRERAEHDKAYVRALALATGRAVARAMNGKS